MIAAKVLLFTLLYLGSTIAFAAVALSHTWSLPVTTTLLIIAAFGSFLYLRIFAYLVSHSFWQRRMLAHHPEIKTVLENHRMRHPDKDCPSLTESRYIMNVTQGITLSSGLVCTLILLGLIWRMIG